MTLDTNSIPLQPPSPYRKQGEEIVRVCVIVRFTIVERKKNKYFHFTWCEGRVAKICGPTDEGGEG